MLTSDVGSSKRVAALCCCVLAAMSACAQQEAPATTSNEPPPQISADSLVVSVEDVRRIADFDGLAPEPALDLRQPGHSDSDAPPPCRAVFDQQFAFGSGWSQFRSVTYNGKANEAGQAPVLNGVEQAVGVYPNDAAARRAFARLAEAVTACSELHAKDYDFAVRKQDTSTVALRHEQFDSMYRVKSSVLIEVAVSQFSQSGQIASSVLKTITDRIQ